MYLCNCLGIMILFLISLVHITGVDQEKNGVLVDFDKKQQWKLLQIDFRSAYVLDKRSLFNNKLWHTQSVEKVLVMKKIADW